MDKHIIIKFKETGEEKYPHMYTVETSDGITYGMAINALVKITDMFINKLQETQRQNEKDNLQLGASQASKEDTGNGCINNNTGANNVDENNLRPV